MPVRLILCALALLAAPASAHAAFFKGEPIDGPSPDIRELGGMDIARDGTGGLVYTKLDAGVAHVFVSRLYDGVWHAPERVDAGIPSEASQPVIAAIDDNRLAIAWVSGGRLFGTIVAGGAPTALPAPAQIYADPDPLGAVRNPDVDMSINGTAYVSFTAPGGGGADVRAMRLQGTTWEIFPMPLDIDPARAAGDGGARSQVGVSAEGNAVVVWGEADRIYGRRVTGMALSVAPQEISVGELNGQPGGAADSVDLDIEDDGSYAWAVFRQDFGGVSRAIARRLVGSLFEPAAIVDTGVAAEDPRIDMNGRGIGAAVAGGRGSNEVHGSVLEEDAFKPPFRLDTAGSVSPPTPVVATTEREGSILSWRRDPGGGGPAVVRVRQRDRRMPWMDETELSNPALGPVVARTLHAGADRGGNFATAWLQGLPGGVQVVVGVFDRPPGTPIGHTSSNFQKRRKPRLKWNPGLDLWGRQSFKVLVDDQEVGTTQANQFVMPTEIEDGLHTWQVISVDRRGQQTRMRKRSFRVDVTPPFVEVKVEGKRSRGQALRIRVSADDPDSGLALVTVDFGDRTPKTSLLRSVHRYRRAGRYTLRVTARDRAGNRGETEISLRIRK